MKAKCSKAGRELLRYQTRTENYAKYSSENRHQDISNQFLVPREKSNISPTLRKGDLRIALHYLTFQALPSSPTLSLNPPDLLSWITYCPKLSLYPQWSEHTGVIAAGNEGYVVYDIASECTTTLLLSWWNLFKKGGKWFRFCVDMG